MDKHPLEEIFDHIAARLSDAPSVVTIPREEMIRFARSQFYVGAAAMMKGLCALLLKLPKNASEHADIMAAFIHECSQHIIGEKTMTVDQALATMRAHKVKEPAE